ncbi:hypothetical protein [Spirosoma sp. KUDC1026]|uniref:hypothetical protein n=1 Tax=Spirosoma sp. KUDC1026 TaxID=2745947 RepID=UPI00159BB7B7|nr:hypothetical protein [Spirosoma sp. KUDC1026]QKZ15321.1 hypothetical protein HU175_22935 [Spirosoma sp. KUDC1026]
MNRTIVTRSNRPTSGPFADGPTLPRNDVTDGYQTQFLKLMPVEVISAYITIDGLLRGSVLPSAHPTVYAWLLWVVFILLAVINPFYLRYVGKVSSWRQIGLSAGAFVVYAISLGGPFGLLGLDEAIIRLIGSILIPIYTLIALIVLNR